MTPRIVATAQPAPKHPVLCTYSRQGGHREVAVITMHDDIDHIDLCRSCVLRAYALLEVTT